MKKLLPLLMLVFSSYAMSGVIVGDKEWRQLTETHGLDWYQVSSVCSQLSGECDGAVGLVSFTGWTWASVFDVMALFNDYIGSDVLGPTLWTATGTYTDTDSLWAPQFFSDFQPNRLEAPYPFAFGTSRSSVLRSAYAPLIYDSPTIDRAYIDNVSSYAVTNTGYWLYRPVPEPGTLGLLSLGLLGLAITRQKRIRPVLAKNYISQLNKEHADR